MCRPVRRLCSSMASTSRSHDRRNDGVHAARSADLQHAGDLLGILVAADPLAPGRALVGVAQEPVGADDQPPISWPSIIVVGSYGLRHRWRPPCPRQLVSDTLTRRVSGSSGPSGEILPAGRCYAARGAPQVSVPGRGRRRRPRMPGAPACRGQPCDAEDHGCSRRVISRRCAQSWPRAGGGAQRGHHGCRQRVAR